MSSSSYNPEEPAKKPSAFDEFLKCKYEIDVWTVGGEVFYVNSDKDDILLH